MNRTDSFKSGRKGHLFRFFRFLHNKLFSSTLIVMTTLAGPVFAGESYTLFEAGQVKPLAMSHNGVYLYAANTPDNRLEVYEIKADKLVH
ncbi:MAG: hypothetical protein OEY07_09955, partial [Gammaproteobacteria bacterium]|nr:hypothetical protein [Gammaproteobacteria bacterium]